MNTMVHHPDNESQDFKIEVQSFGESRGIAITGYKGNLKSITIPDAINDMPVRGIGDWAFRGRTGITGINFPAGLLSIGEYAFEKCTGLSAVTFPAGLDAIKKGAFSGCNRLTAITFPDSLTAIGSGVFAECGGLTSITLPAGLASIGERAFFGCNRITEIRVAEGNQAYSSIEGILFDKGGTTLMWYPKGREDKTYTIPEGVKHIGDWAFEGCRRLTEVALPDGLISIGHWAFAECGLTGITFPMGLTAIKERAFFRCSRFTRVTLPPSIVSIGEYAFADCSNLETIVLSRNIKIGNGAFYHAPGQLTYRSQQANPKG